MGAERPVVFHVVFLEQGIELDAGTPLCFHSTEAFSACDPTPIYLTAMPLQSRVNLPSGKM